MDTFNRKPLVILTGAHIPVAHGWREFTGACKNASCVYGEIVFEEDKTSLLLLVCKVIRNLGLTYMWLKSWWSAQISHSNNWTPHCQKLCGIHFSSWFFWDGYVVIIRQWRGFDVPIVVRRLSSNHLKNKNKNKEDWVQSICEFSLPSIVVPMDTRWWFGVQQWGSLMNWSLTEAIWLTLNPLWALYWALVHVDGTHILNPWRLFGFFSRGWEINEFGLGEHSEVRICGPWSWEIWRCGRSFVADGNSIISSPNRGFLGKLSVIFVGCCCKRAECGDVNHI